MTAGAALERLRCALRGRGKSSSDGRSWTCPAHDDRHPSLSIGQGDRCAVVKCHAGCSTESIVRALGLEMRDLFDGQSPLRAGRRLAEPDAVYPYRDETGTLLFEVVRMPGKEFRQRRPDPARPGRHLWSRGATRPVLYRLPELRAAAGGDRRVFIVEGEKDVETLHARGEIATCNPGGAGKWKAVATLANEVLHGAQVVVIADKDEPGLRHAHEVAHSVRAVAESVVVCQAKVGKDVTDHLEAGLGLEELVEVAPQQVESAPTNIPVQRPRSTSVRGTLIRCDDNLSRQVAEAEGVLAGNVRVFQRGGRLVQVVRDAAAPAWLHRAHHAPRAQVLTQARVAELLTEGARFERRFGRKARWEACLPTRPLVAAIHERGEWPGIRPLEGVIEAPALRPDGTLIRDDGYDRETGLRLDSGRLRVEVPSHPTAADIKRSVQALDEVIADFPLASAAHRAGWIASMLTPLARAAIHGPVPLYLHDANVGGSGKGLLTTSSSVILTGRPAPVMTAPTHEEEFEKRVTAIALAGYQIVLLDNVTGTLRSAALDAVLTAPDTWSGRLLGATQMVTVPARMTWFATGNNVSTSSDLAARIVHVRLESPYECPRERPSSDFRHPKLVEWIVSERPRLLGAALTVLVGYVSAGRPDQRLPAWGSFESWSDLIRGAVVWAGWADPAGSRSGLRQDADRDALVAAQLLIALEPVVGRRGLAAADLLHVADAADTDDARRLRDALLALDLSPGADLPSAHELGNALLRHRDRVVGGRCLRRGKKSSAGVLWTIDHINGEHGAMTVVTHVTSGRP